MTPSVHLHLFCKSGISLKLLQESTVQVRSQKEGPGYRGLLGINSEIQTTPSRDWPEVRHHVIPWANNLPHLDAVVWSEVSLESLLSVLCGRSRNSTLNFHSVVVSLISFQL